MPRISESEYAEICQEVESRLQSGIVSRYVDFVQKLKIPNPNDHTPSAAAEAVAALNELSDAGFDILDLVLGTRGYGPSSSSDTHFRGRALELVLNGIFSGKSSPDFAYGDLKLIECADRERMVQVMTVGIIAAADRKNLEYEIPDEFKDSKFYQKAKSLIIQPYLKKGKQLGFKQLPAFNFRLEDGDFEHRCREDWYAIRDHLSSRVQLARSGKIVRRASGICKSDTDGKRTPNGLLGIRSDSVIITKKLFKEMVEFYT